MSNNAIAASGAAAAAEHSRICAAEPSEAEDRTPLRELPFDEMGAGDTWDLQVSTVTSRSTHAHGKETNRLVANMLSSWCRSTQTDIVWVLRAMPSRDEPS